MVNSCNYRYGGMFKHGFTSGSGEIDGDLPSLFGVSNMTLPFMIHRVNVFFFFSMVLMIMRSMIVIGASDAYHNG